MEKKYQEKINTLQTQVDKEREILSSQASNQTSKLLDEMDQLRSDEGMMKERVQAMTEVCTHPSPLWNSPQNRLLMHTQKWNFPFFCQKGVTILRCIIQIDIKDLDR